MMTNTKIYFTLFCTLFFYQSLIGQIELEIWEIQGTGVSSLYEDSLVTTKDNIVTMVTDDRFFIQTPPERVDNDTLSSDGIMVFVGSPFDLAIGDQVSVTGIIQEYFGLTEFGPNNLSFEIDSSGLALPAPIQLNAGRPSTEIQSIPDLEKLEGMRVQFVNARASGPKNDDLLPMSLQAERPFREPGIAYPGLTGLPVWDNNPEVFQLNLRWTGGIPYSTGVVVDATGVLTFDNDQYQVIPETLDAQGDRVLVPVRDKTELEATIGSINCFVFSNTSNDFQARRSKMAHYIIEQLKAPDILAVQEVRNLATLQQLAAEIESIQPEVVYDAYLEPGNQSGSFQINNGFLVRNTIANVQIDQWGKEELLSLGGSLHDRPPLLLSGEFTTDPPTPIRVLNIHLRSLGGIEGGSANFVRTKRWEQAISVANMMRDLQFQNLVVVGDFNAFQFSDGYVDVLAQLTGDSTLGAEFPIIDIVDFPVTNHSLSVAPEEQYSFIFRGNAQILDHCLSTNLTNLSVNEFQYARGNADNPDVLVDNIFVPYRASDHDGYVLFLGIEDTLSVGIEDNFENELVLSFPNPFKKGDRFIIKTATGQKVHLELFDQLGRRMYYKQFDQFSNGEYSFAPSWSLQSGMYYIKLSGDHDFISKKIIVD